MDENEKRIRRRLRDDFPHYARKCLKIRTKSQSIISFEFNKAQLHVHDKLEHQKLITGKVRAIILKGRQQGMSTLIGGRFFHITTHSFGLQAFILTHALDATNNLFKMTQRYYENCPAIMRPEASTSNSKELIFGGLDSGYKIGTAENKAVGRSSTIQLFHGSEVAFWANASEHAKGILQAVPSEKGTEVIFESTANGVGNYFHQQWQLAEAGLSDFIAIFVPWFWQAEYQREPDVDFAPDEKEIALIDNYGLTHAQLAWRRYKIVELSVGGDDGELGFCQEYPNSSIEAFLTSGEDSFISPELVTNGRKTETEAVGALIVGADIARFGDDRTCFCWRRGRKIEKIVSYSKKDTMEVAGLLHLVIEQDDPKKVCIDVGGLGAGVYDRLVELGHGDVVYPVNGGESPINAKRYMNKRAEIWGEFKAWLAEAPVQIPDIDTLHADICGTRYKVDSKGRICLEKKEDMKKRGIRSPDEADACTLTFALPESAYREIIKEKDKKVAQRITSSFAKTMELRGKRNGIR